MNIALLLAIVIAAAGEEINPRYEDCVALVAADLEAGRKAAQQWAGAGGGADAQHCLAIADIAAGFPKLAAARLEDIAQRKDAGDDFVRARLLAQAAEAWLDAGELEFAAAAVKAAFDLASDAGELHLTAAKINRARENWPQAITSVNAAEKAGFATVEAFLIRARAYMALGDYQLAAEDVVNALTIEPTNISALVLRGEIQQAGVKIDFFYSAPETNN